MKLSHFARGHMAYTRQSQDGNLAHARITSKTGHHTSPSLGDRQSRMSLEGEKRSSLALISLVSHEEDSHSISMP